jgi:hypothetical protein
MNDSRETTRTQIPAINAANRMHTKLKKIKMNKLIIF